MGKSIAYNSRVAFMEKAITGLISLFLIPVIVIKIGIDSYGFWVFLSAVSGYLSLAHGGLIFSFDRYIAEYVTRYDHEMLHKIICTGFYAILTICICILIPLIIFNEKLLFLLIKGRSFANVSQYFIVVIAFFLLSLLGRIFIAVAQGYQRFDLNSYLNILAKISFAVSVLLLLHKGFSFKALVIANAVEIIILFGGSIVISSYLLGGLKLFPKLFDLAILKMLYNYGSKVFVAQIANMTSLHFDKFLVSFFLGIQFVGIYDIGAKIVIFVREIPMLIFGIVLPRTSQLNALNQREAIQDLYVRGTKITAVFSFFIIAALFPVAQNLMQLWLGSALNPLSVYTFQVLLIGAMVQVTAGFASSVSKGLNKPILDTYANLVMLFVNIAFSTLFLLLFGYKGVVYGTLLACISNPISNFILLNRLLSIKPYDFAIKTLVVPGVILFSYFSLFLVSSKLFPETFLLNQHRDIYLVVINVALALSLNILIYRIFDRVFFETTTRTVIPQRIRNMAMSDIPGKPLNK